MALFNALHDTDYTLDEVSIRDVRINNTIYMNLRNDISFDVNERMVVLSEHQSTINRNMPLRSLIHIGRTYEQMVPIRDRYKKAMVELPIPEFYVLYNGTEYMERETTLRLSDAYVRMEENITPEEKKKGLVNVVDSEGTNKVSLELTVKVININLEAGADILEKCPILKEYSQFVSCVRKHKAAREEEAMKNAIGECIAKGILKDYLERRGSEVRNMLCAEYDYDLDMEVHREETMDAAILDILEDIGEVPRRLEYKIRRESNFEKLRKLHKLSAKVESIEEFEEKMESIL